MQFAGCRIFCAFALVLLVGTQASPVVRKKARNGPVFGSQVPISGALRGTVYRLFKDTAALPDLTHLKPVGVVYTNTLDYPLREYGDEWFAIEYEGVFYVSKPGKYRFLLTSDDGAKLFIDGKRVIDNDGIHPVATLEGSIGLEVGAHKLRLPYFQGPVPYVALVLEVEPPGGKHRVFDMDEFRWRADSDGLSPDTRPTLRR
jgi:hypothetical protein